MKSNDVEQPKNPPVQISDIFVMPREVAVRLLLCNCISNKTRKRCKQAMQIAVVSRAPILQEMKFAVLDIPGGTSAFAEALGVMEKGDRVYNLLAMGKSVEVFLARMVAKLSLKQLGAKIRRIPAQRKQSQWAALHGADMTRRSAAEQRVNILDEMLDACEEEVSRRTKVRV